MYLRAMSDLCFHSSQSLPSLLLYAPGCSDKLNHSGDVLLRFNCYTASDTTQPPPSVGHILPPLRLLYYPSDATMHLIWPSITMAPVASSVS